MGKWLIPGEYGFDEKIWGKLQESDIMVLVSTRKTAYSKKVRKEVLEATSLKKPIIALKKRGTRFPFSKKVREKHWVPELDFNPRNPSYIFPKVAIYILSNMEQLTEDRQCARD